MNEETIIYIILIALVVLIIIYPPILAWLFILFLFCL